MSDEAKPDAPQVDPVLKFKFNGTEVAYDLTKTEDRQRLTEDAQLGRFSQKQTAQLAEMKTKLVAAESSEEFKLGKGLRDYLASDPVGASTLMETYRALQERRADPSRIRQALLEQSGGDASTLEAQARASGDPEARALLNQMAQQLRDVQRRTEELSSSQERKELDLAIRGTLSAEDWLKGRPMAQERAQRRTRELLADGMTLDLAASQALREEKDTLNEAANVEAVRLRAQKESAVVKTSAGIPAIGEYLQKKVDPKAKKWERDEQRVSGLKDLFKSIVRQAEGTG